MCLAGRDEILKHAPPLLPTRRRDRHDALREPAPALTRRPKAALPPKHRRPERPLRRVAEGSAPRPRFSGRVTARRWSGADAPGTNVQNAPLSPSIPPHFPAVFLWSHAAPSSRSASTRASSGRIRSRRGASDQSRTPTRPAWKPERVNPPALSICHQRNMRLVSSTRASPSASAPNSGVALEVP